MLGRGPTSTRGPQGCAATAWAPTSSVDSTYPLAQSLLLLSMAQLDMDKLAI
jgi:hypothetical protein